MLTKKILHLLPLCFVLSQPLIAVAMEDMDYITQKPYELVIDNQTDYSIWISVTDFKYHNDNPLIVNSCPFTKTPSNELDNMQPLVKHSTQTASWNCYEPLGIKFRLINKQENTITFEKKSIQAPPAFDLRNEQDKYAVDITVEIASEVFSNMNKRTITFKESNARRLP